MVNESPKPQFTDFGLLILSVILFLGGVFILSLKIPFWSLFLGIAAIQIGIVLIILTFEIFTSKKSKSITEDYQTIPCLICKNINYVPKYRKTTICDTCQLKIAQSAKSFLIVILAVFSVASLTRLVKNSQDIRRSAHQEIIQNSPPTVFNPFPYSRPTLPQKSSYLTLILGDSMVKALGDNAEQLRQSLKGYYPNKEFVNYIYGFSSTNITSLPKIFNQGITEDGKNYPAISAGSYDLLIIESFAYNPLSDLPLEQGLTKQTEILDQVIKNYLQTHPVTVVAILATIAPSKTYFAKGVYDLSPENRQRWAEERIAYIENAIKYATERNLPLINVYEKSLTSSGEGNLKYIDPHDYIHPSAAGVKLISKTIADFIYNNQIYPY